MDNNTKITLPDTVIKTPMTPEEIKKVQEQMLAALSGKNPEKKIKKDSLKAMKFDLVDVFIDMIYNERYYAVTLSKLAKIETKAIPTMGVTFNQAGKFILIFNPDYVNALTLPEAIGLLKHEVQHIFFRHLSRFVTKDHKLHKLYNFCTDAAINQYIDVLPEGGIYPKSLVTTLTGLGLDENVWYGFPNDMTADWYIAEALKIKIEQPPQNGEGESEGGEGESEGQGQSQGQGQGQDQKSKGKGKGKKDQNKNGQGQSQGQGQQGQDQDQQGQGGQTIDDHSNWNQVYNTDTDKLEQASDHDIDPEFENEVFVKKIIDELEAKGIGDLPSFIQKEIKLFKEKKRFPWEHQLKVFVQSVLSTTKRLSQKRINKRILHTDDLILPGKRKDFRPRILVARDTSGSVFNDKTQDSFLNEILCMQKYAEIIVVDCDTEIHQEYYVEKRTDFKKYEGGGGTSFVPVFERAEKLKIDGIIYLTDCDGTFPSKALAKKFSSKTIWVTVNQSSVAVPFGKHVNIEE